MATNYAFVMQKFVAYRLQQCINFQYDIPSNPSNDFNNHSVLFVDLISLPDVTQNFLPWTCWITAKRLELSSTFLLE